MNTSEKNAIIVDTTCSPHASLRPVPVNAVSLSDNFWAPRLKINREVTLPSQYQQCEDTGRIDNFRRAAGTKDVPFQGKFFNDSDVYKWLEGAAWAMASADDKALSRMMEAVVDAIAAAQQEDGYLNTYFMFERAGERWSKTDDCDWHELYCAGHLMQAAVAHYRSTGDDRLLVVACRLADHIDTVFRGAKTEPPPTDGHPEIEMALVELARTTGEQRYLQLAQFFIDARGRDGAALVPHDPHYAPLRAITDATGHAVCSVYLKVGATDLFAETGEEALGAALWRQWENMTQRRMYLSGGVGARYAGEAFGKDYELPNARAYAETCAAIACVMWNWRMLQLQGDAHFADAMEQTLYNGVLSGLSLDGTQYFYQNPLADNGTHRRQHWFGCACCPPNIARLLASLPGYFYSVSDDAVWVHLYAEGHATLTLPDSSTVELVQHTCYPWDGDITLEVNGEGEWELRLRIPAWCEAGAMLAVNDEAMTGSLQPGSYAGIRRAWQSGDIVRLHLPMPVRTVEAHPHLTGNAHQGALRRGPLLYCLEAVDQPHINLNDVVLPQTQEYGVLWQPKLLGGVTTLDASALCCTPGVEWEGRLYRAAGTSSKGRAETKVEVTAIPYYAWANREPGAMRVWLRMQRA